MSVVVVGLSHRTVPLDLLERMAVTPAALPKALGDLVGRDFVTEAVILSTCHRTEVYAVAERFHGAVQDVRHFLSGLAFVPPEDFTDHLYTYHDEAAVAHLFAVAAGLDSVVLGESEILGQVRWSWERACTEGAARGRLSELFRHAIEVGKRARSETGISRGITSLSQAAVAMALVRVGSLAGKRVLVLGAGEMGESVALAVRGAGPAEIVVANRTGERARDLADRVQGRAVALGELSAALHAADVVLTSTGSASTVLEHAELASVVAARDGRPLLIVDVAMPRDVDPSVRELPGVTLLDLADLRAFVQNGLDERRREVARVRGILEEELARYQERATAREMAPTLASLHGAAERVRSAELARFRARLGGLDPRQQEAVEALTRGIVGKLLHEPTSKLKDAAGSPRGERLAGALRELFDL